jgi:DNA-binding MurR/RpiR family transcriptional regulator
LYKSLGSHETESLADLVAANGSTLTASQLRIAEVVLADPTQVAFGTIAQVADLAGTSGPSVVRFSRRLGFEGFSDLQTYVQQRLARQASRPTDRIRPPLPGAATSATSEAIERAVASAVAVSHSDRFSEFVKEICEAKHISIASGETSRSGAYALVSGLTMIRPDVRLLDDHDMARDITGFDPNGLLIAIDFPRYRRSTVELATTLASLGVPVISITDGPLSPLAGLTQSWCSLDVPAVGPFDSSVPVVLLCELLVAAAAAALGTDATARIDQTEELWVKTDIYWSPEAS